MDPEQLAARGEANFPVCASCAILTLHLAPRPHRTQAAQVSQLDSAAAREVKSACRHAPEAGIKF